MASNQGNPDSRLLSISGEQGKRARAAEHFDLGSVLISSLGDAKQSKQWGQHSNLRECLSVWHSWDGMSPCWGASTHARVMKKLRKLPQKACGPDGISYMQRSRICPLKGSLNCATCCGSGNCLDDCLIRCAQRWFCSYQKRLTLRGLSP